MNVPKCQLGKKKQSEQERKAATSDDDFFISMIKKNVCEGKKRKEIGMERNENDVVDLTGVRNFF